MAQWLQHLPGELKDRHSDPSNGQVWRSTCNPSILEAEKVPWGKTALLSKLARTVNSGYTENLSQEIGWRVMSGDMDDNSKPFTCTNTETNMSAHSYPNTHHTYIHGSLNPPDIQMQNMWSLKQMQSQ